MGANGHMWAGATALDRFEDKYSVDDNGCWLWKASLRPNGYSQFFDGSKVVYGHRWSHTHFKGAIPEGLQIDHLCRVRSCVNPEHLEAVTMEENVKRGEVGEYWDRTHCQRGHEYTPANSYHRPDKSNTKECRKCRNYHKKLYRQRKALR